MKFDLIICLLCVSAHHKSVGRHRDGCDHLDTGVYRADEKLQREIQGAATDLAKRKLDEIAKNVGVLKARNAYDELGAQGVTADEVLTGQKALNHQAKEIVKLEDDEAEDQNSLAEDQNSLASFTERDRRVDGPMAIDLRDAEKQTHANDERIIDMA